MRFYTKVHEAYCGIDLHARTMDCLHLKSVFEKSPAVRVALPSNES
jgi:hypothetical protein